MQFLVICAITVTILAVGPLLYNHYYVIWKSKQLAKSKYDAVQPLLKKLANKQTISPDEVQTLADNPSLRVAVFRILEEYGRMDLFPGEQLTKAKGAESFMVNWLEYPTELGMAPNQIELVESVSPGVEKELEYFVFKFRTLPPHRAAGSGWMIGVSGPYASLAIPYDVPRRVFSRFNKVGSETAATEVQWVHENINPH